MIVCTVDEITIRRNNFGPIIFTNGCFDLLHEGHIKVLEYCNKIKNTENYEDKPIVVVGLNDDVSVYQLKGYERPIRYFDERYQDIDKLGIVDVLIPIYNISVMDTLKVLWPDYLVKGGSTKEIVGEDFVKSYGGEVHRVDMLDGVSTTQKIKMKDY